MYGKLIHSLSAILLLCLVSSVVGQPVPVFHSTLNDAASVTDTGGVIAGGGVFVPTTVPAGSIAKFQSTGNSTVNWDTTETDNIFAGWDKTQGITVDLYFLGIGEAAGDVGLWSVGKRQGGDNFLILVARDDELRFNIRDEGGTGDIGGGTHTILTSGVDLNPVTTYRLTVRQHSSLGNGGDLEIFLESISDSGAQYPATDLHIRTLDLPAGDFDFPSYDGGSPAEPLAMRVGDKYPHFGGSGFELRNGDSIDNVRVFNGIYLPSELGAIPEPCTLLPLAAGTFALFRRRRL